MKNALNPIYQHYELKIMKDWKLKRKLATKKSIYEEKIRSSNNVLQKEISDYERGYHLGLIRGFEDLLKLIAELETG